MSRLEVVVCNEPAPSDKFRVVVRMLGNNMLTVSKGLLLDEADQLGGSFAYILNAARALGLAEGVRRVAGHEAGQAALDDAMNAADALFASTYTKKEDAA